MLELEGKPMISEADFPDVFPWMKERKPCSKDSQAETFSGESLEKRSAFTSWESVAETEDRAGQPSHGTIQLPVQARTTYVAVTSARVEQTRKDDVTATLAG